MSILASLVAIGQACSEPTAPTPPPVADLVLSIPESEVLFSTIGETRTLTATVARGNSPVAANITWWSNIDSVARISPSGQLRARVRGAARIYAVSDSGGIDSVSVIVEPVPTRIEFRSLRASLMLGRSSELTVDGYDAANVRIPGVPAIVSIDDTLIASVATRGVITAGGVGATVVRATLGTATTSRTLLVTPLPLLRFGTDTILLAPGLQHSPPVPMTADSLAVNETLLVTSLLTNAALAWATDTFALPQLSNHGTSMQMGGLGVGNTRLRISAPGWAPAEVPVVVRPARLQRSPFPAVVMAGRPSETWVGTADSAGRTALALQSHLVTFVSSDTSILRVANDTATLRAGGIATVGLSGVRAGVGRIVATAAGFAPETIPVTVRDAGLYIRGLQSPPGSRSPQMLGVGHRATWHRIGATGFIGGVSPDVEIILTQRAPDKVRLPTTPLRLSINASELTLVLDGLATGVDTVVATAAGYLPDTLIVVVTRPAFVTTTPASAVMTGLLTLSGNITDSIPVFSFTERGDAPLTIQVVSSDPTILRPESPQVVIPAGARTYTIPILFSSNGSAFLTLSDPTGVYRTEQTAPIEVRRAPLKLTPHAGIGGPDLVLGVRQRMLVALESPGAARSGFGVRIRSTNPSVAQPVQDSLPALGTGIDLIAGAQPGSAWLVAEGRGFSADSIRITVTRGRIVAGNPGGLATGLVNAGMTVRSVDENGNERVTLDSLFFRVRSTNGSRLFFVNSTGVIPAGASRGTSIIYNTVAVGPVVVEVIATRPLAPFVETSTTPFVIVSPLAPLRAAPDSGTAARAQPPPRDP